jgi:hypothetical protein
VRARTLRRPRATGAYSKRLGMRETARPGTAGREFATPRLWFRLGCGSGAGIVTVCKVMTLFSVHMVITAYNFKAENKLQC